MARYHKPEEIIGKLREAETGLSSGTREHILAPRNGSTALRPCLLFGERSKC